MTAAARLDRAAALIADGSPPYTGTTPTFRNCGHPRTPINMYSNGRCVTCERVRALEAYEPVLCGTCAKPLGPGRTNGFHRPCEPTTCNCPGGGRPDGLGECGTCHRLVLTASWHDGRPQ